MVGEGINDASVLGIAAPLVTSTGFGTRSSLNCHIYGGGSYETRRLFDDPANALGHDQPSTRAGSGKEYLLGVSRNPKRAASVSEFEGADLGRDCKYSWNDLSGLAPDAHDASCGDADVHVEPRTKTTDH